MNIDLVASRIKTLRRLRHREIKRLEDMSRPELEAQLDEQAMKVARLELRQERGKRIAPDHLEEVKAKLQRLANKKVNFESRREARREEIASMTEEIEALQEELQEDFEPKQLEDLSVCAPVEPVVTPEQAEEAAERIASHKTPAEVLAETVCGGFDWDKMRSNADRLGVTFQVGMTKSELRTELISAAARRLHNTYHQTEKTMDTQFIDFQEGAKYVPALFKAFGFDAVEFETVEETFSDVQEVREAIKSKDYSFVYLRDGEARLVRCYRGAEMIEPDEDFSEFLEETSLEFEGRIFKTGKYISRIFRATEHWTFLDEIDIFNNTKMAEKYPTPANDGLSLISVELAQDLGLKGKHAQHGASGQLTVLNSEGLIKGHYTVSNKIDHDVVRYGEENIKRQVKWHDGRTFVAVEPVKLSEPLFLDVQSMANLAYAFGMDQIRQWGIDGIQTAIKKTKEGDIVDWLGGIDNLDPEDYDPEKEIGAWRLQEAMRRDVGYLEFPKLVADAWNLFASEMEAYASDVFRVPVPGGVRAYVRTDRINHDKDGNYRPIVDKNEIRVDEAGNLFIHPEDAEHFHAVHGGSDEDDMFAIVPLKSGKSLLYRNPNQYGEVGVYDVTFRGRDPERQAYLIEDPESFPSTEMDEEEAPEEPVQGQSVRFDPNAKVDPEKDQSNTRDWSEYTVSNVLKAWNKANTDANIGAVSNAEMVRSHLKLTDEEMFEYLRENFEWVLEDIIDAQVKDGEDAMDSMNAAKAMFKYLIKHEVPVAKCMVSRFPGFMQDDVTIAENHPLDELMGEIYEDVQFANWSMTGKMDSTREYEDVTPFIHQIAPDWLKLETGDGSMRQHAKNARSAYNQVIAKAMEESDRLKRQGKHEEAEDYRMEKIEEAREIIYDQIRFLEGIDPELPVAFISDMAALVYEDEKHWHDSVLWVPDKHERIKIKPDETIKGAHLANGTSRYMLKALQKAGMAKVLELDESPTDELDGLWAQLMEASGVDLESMDMDPKAGSFEKTDGTAEHASVNLVRTWISSNDLDMVEDLDGADVFWMDVHGRKATVAYLSSGTEKEVTLNLGDEVELKDDRYEPQAVKKTTDNSFTFFLGEIEEDVKVAPWDQEEKTRDEEEEEFVPGPLPI